MTDRSPDITLPSKPSEAVVNVFCDAAIHDDTAAVAQYLNQYGAAIINEKCGAGLTALTLAGLAGSLKAAALLLKNGADPEIKNDNESDDGNEILGDTALTAVARGAHLITVGGWNTRKKMMTLLVENGADVNARNNAGDTPLMLAIEFGDNDPVRQLLEKGADTDAKNNAGQNALFVAAGEGRAYHVELLLERGMNVDQRDSCGQTPLILAAWNGRGVVVARLLEAKADIEAQDDEGYTALTAADHEGHAYIVELLRKFSDMRIQKEKKQYEDVLQSRLQKLKNHRPSARPF